MMFMLTFDDLSQMHLEWSVNRVIIEYKTVVCSLRLHTFVSETR